MTPDKDPTFWAEVSRVLSNPLWQGAIMAATISLLRVLYDAKETKVWRVILESLICGGLSLSASSIIKWMDWPEGLSVAAGGMIGFLGVTAIREFALKFIGKKVETL
jgi:lambda family phage holin